MGPYGERATALFSGRVQGVGFRYTAQDLADSLGLSGWVHNLRDGRVELVLEGPKGDIEELVKKLGVRFSVSATSLSWERSEGSLSSFEIRP